MDRVVVGRGCVAGCSSSSSFVLADSSLACVEMLRLGIEDDAIAFSLLRVLVSVPLRFLGHLGSLELLSLVLETFLMRRLASCRVVPRQADRSLPLAAHPRNGSLPDPSRCICWIYTQVNQMLFKCSYVLLYNS